MEQPNGSTQATAEIHRIEIGVGWPPGHVSVYFVDCAEPVLVDAGMSGENARMELEQGLESAGSSLAEIEHLVITHPHVDHIGQFSHIVSVADPTIYAPQGARSRLTRDPADLEAAVRANAIEAGLQGDVLEEAISKSVDSLERNRALLDPSQVDLWIEDRQEFSVGELTLRAIHTPGHQADHLCYQTAIEDKSILFSGDILLEPFRSVMIHAGLDDGVEEGVPAFLGALDRLDDLDVVRVYPGHGSPHEDLTGTVERSRRSIERMVDRAKKYVCDGESTALELASRRAGDRAFHYVLPEVVSAFRYLESTGEITSRLDEGIKYYRGPETSQT